MIINKKILITGGSGFIGTNLISFLEGEYQQMNILNLDIKSPKMDNHKKYWLKVDINNYEILRNAVKNFSPDFIVHFAAEADVKFKSISDFKTNIIGVENLCKIVNECDSIKRVVFTSTQYVNQFHGQPLSDEEYHPFTVYGESKVEGEKIVRHFNLKKEWVIIRPTNVYGPFNDVYVKGLFNVIKQGKYYHPNINVLRSYGYVGNVVQQIYNIFYCSSELVNKKTFYVGDEPIFLEDFVLAIHKRMGYEKIKKLPKGIFKIASIFGEILKIVNLPFPMNKTRYINMVTPNPINMDKTFQVLGKGNYSFEESISKTIDWYLNLGSR